MKKYTKGFTLIELLVVIAIIGILSSVVLASLNTARGKGANANVKSNLANMRAQAAIIYDSASPNSYAGITTDATILNASSSIQSAGGSSPKIYGDANGFVMAANLKTTEGTFTAYCVDSTGKSEGISSTTYITGATTLCP